MSLLSIVASSSAFLLPSSPPPKGSSIDSDWSIKNKKQPGFLRLISAWYAMVSLHFSHHDSASLPGLDPESRAPVPCGANQTARQQQPCQRPVSCKLACWRTFGGQPNRIPCREGFGRCQRDIRGATREHERGERPLDVSGLQDRAAIRVRSASKGLSRSPG